MTFTFQSTCPLCQSTQTVDYEQDKIHEGPDICKATGDPCNRNAHEVCGIYLSYMYDQRGE